MNNFSVLNTWMCLFIILIGCTSENQKNDGLTNYVFKDSLTNDIRIDDSLISSNNNDSLKFVETILPDYLYPTKPSIENWQEDIGEVFIMLPDTFFLKHKSMNKYIGLNHKKRKQLISGKKVVIDQNCIVSFENDDEFNQINRQEKFLTLDIFHKCIEGQGVSYRLRPWVTIEGEKIFGLYQIYDDWCCEHSNYWFLKPIEGGWLDVTEKVIGKITLYDFKRGNQSFPKNKDFKKFINDPWFGAEVYYFTDTIKFHLDFDVLGLSMSDETYDSASNQLNYELQLIWNGRVFKKNLIQRTDLDD